MSLFWDPIASRTAVKSDISIVPQIYVGEISKFILFSFNITEETLKYILYNQVFLTTFL